MDIKPLMPAPPTTPLRKVDPRDQPRQDDRPRQQHEEQPPPDPEGDSESVIDTYA